jgi:hypothetical protein
MTTRRLEGYRSHLPSGAGFIALSVCAIFFRNYYAKV